MLSCISTLNECLASINDWMSSNFLKLNEGKMDILLLGPQMERSGLSLELGTLVHNNLSVLVDLKLSFTAHISTITQTQPGRQHCNHCLHNQPAGLLQCLLYQPTRNYNSFKPVQPDFNQQKQHNISLLLQSPSACLWDVQNLVVPW